jgi:hypothetical protein
MGDELGAWDSGADDLVYVAGRDYVRSWLTARELAAEMNAALDAAALRAVRALPGTDAAGRLVVRLRGSPEAMRCVVCLLRRGAGASSRCDAAAECETGDDADSRCRREGGG